MIKCLIQFLSSNKWLKVLKESAKAEQQEKQLKNKVKEAIEKNMGESAKIFAQDAIRKKNEAKRYLILSSKLEAVTSRIQNAYQHQMVNNYFL